MNEQDIKEIERIMVMPPPVSSELPRLMKPALPQPSDEDIRLAYGRANKILLALGLIMMTAILVLLGFYWLF